MANGRSPVLPSDKSLFLWYDEVMSKYSRKVRGWGGLGNYTEHRNKKGDVTARTRYHEGKAITTHVPKKPAYTKPGYRGRASQPSGFEMAGASLLTIIFVIGGIGVGIGFIFNLVNESLTGVWPVIRVIVTWLAVAAWAATVVHLVYATIRRFDYDGGFMTWLTTVSLSLLALLGGLTVLSLVIGPDAYQSGPLLSNLSGLGLLASLLVYPIALVSVIVFAAMFSKRWLLVILGAVVMFFWLVLAVPDNGALGVGLTASVLYAALMVRFNIERD